MDYSNLSKSGASLSSPESLLYESLYELALSESLSSFSLLSSLAALVVAAWTGAVGAVLTGQVDTVHLPDAIRGLSAMGDIAADNA
jgi:hypothetical protein